MKRCSINGDVCCLYPAISSTEKILRLGLYEEKHFEALNAAVLLMVGVREAPVEKVTLKYNGWNVSVKMLLGAGIAESGFVSCQLSVLFKQKFDYVMVAPNGEIMTLCKDTAVTVDELVEDIRIIASLVFAMCKNNSVDFSEAKFTVSVKDDDQEFAFSYKSLLDLASAIEEGHDDGLPNDPIITERNLAMTREFARLSRAVFNVDSMVFRHKLFSMNLRFKNFKFDVSSVMKPLKEIDKKLHDDIEKFLDAVNEVQPFVEDIDHVVRRMFWKFI